MAARSRKIVSSVYQLKVTLRDCRPPIWRRILVPGNLDLYQLHQVLQVAMGWMDGHLHQFVKGEKYYAIPSDEDLSEIIDERGITLEQLALSAPAAFDYEYDFGDGWTHEVRVEKIGQPTPGEVYPRCIKGRRACPPEDVGGVPGYEEFLRAMADPSHPEHTRYLDWAGGAFDPEEFDVKETDTELRSIRMRRGK